MAVASKRRGTKRGNYGTYDDERRRSAVADVKLHGLVGAAERNGIPKSTLSNWWRNSEAKGDSAVEPRAPTTGDAEKESGPTPEVPAVSKPAVSKPAVSEPAASKPAKPKSGVAKAYTPSQRAEALEYVAAHGITAAHEKFGISRFALHAWRRKAVKAAAGKGDSPTAGPDPSDIEAQRDGEILAEWHQHPGLGPSQIRNQLRRRGIKVSINTTRRVMEDAGYRPPKIRRQPHDERFEAVRPNHMWHLDFVHRHIHSATTFSLILLDDYSRYVVDFDIDDAERADLVIGTFERAVQRHGKPEMVMHDKGSAFWSWRGIARFTALLTELGIDMIPAKYKEWNGKIEVFNGNLHKEFFDVHRYADVAEMRRRLGQHLRWYNHGRTHHALGGLLVPADRFYGRSEEVLALIEGGGTAAHDLDNLDLRGRCLDLFRVSRRDGVAEVWLLGHKLVTLPAK